MAHLIQPMQVTLSKGVNNNDVIYFERARWNYSCLARDRHELNSMGELNFQCKTWITSGGSRNLLTGGAAPAWYNFWGFEIVLMPIHTYPMLLKWEYIIIYIFSTLHVDYNNVYAWYTVKMFKNKWIGLW